MYRHPAEALTTKEIIVNKKQFRVLLANESNDYGKGQLHWAWHDYCHMLHNPKTDSAWISGIASALIVYGFFLCPHMEVVGQLCVAMHFLVSLSMFIYLERKDLAWKGQREAEFRQHNPRAYLLFPSRS